MTIDSLGMGGAETMLVNLVNHFTSEIKSTIITLSDNNPLIAKLSRNDIEVIPVPRSSRYDLSPVQKIKQVIIEHKAHSILCFDLFDFFFVHLALRGFKDHSPRIFIGVHRTYPDNVKDFVQTFMYARLLRNKDLLIAMSDNQADILSRIYMIPRSRFRVIPNGLDTGFFNPSEIHGDKISLRQAHNIRKDAFVILQVANFSKVKRHEDSITAFAYFRQKMDGGPSLLVFVGNGNELRKRTLQDIVAKEGLRNDIIFLGTHNDLRPIYKMSDCFTLSSRTEAFSMAAIEAMALGLPCVLTDVGGARDMLRDGIDGYLVPALRPRSLAQAWLDVYKNRAAFDPVAIRQHVVENFSIAQCVREYELLLG